MELEKDVELLFDIVRDESGLDIKTITSGSRKQEIIYFKRMIGVSLKNHTKYSLSKIGKILGGLDHSSIIHYISSHQKQAEKDPRFKEIYERIDARFKNYVEGNFPVEKKLEFALRKRADINKEITRLRKLVEIKRQMKWVWPVPSVEPKIPTIIEPGSFGFKRKHDIHTGIDIYCEPGSEVVAVEDGIIKNIEWFTGPKAGTYWWRNTRAVWVEGKKGVVVYGEINPAVEIGQKVSAGDLIGKVERVLKKDKGVTPTSMLHIELYSSSMKETVWWKHGAQRPRYLLDPTEFLLESSL